MDEELLNEEISVKEVLQAIFTKIWWIVASAAILALAVMTCTLLFIEPTYKGKTTLYIYDRTGESVSLNELTIGSQLISDFEVMAVSKPVLDRTVQKTGLNISQEQLLSNVTAEQVIGTRFLEITAKNTDPEQAAEIANALADSLVAVVTELMETSHCYIISRATVPEKPVGPNVVLYTVIAAFLGVMFSSAAVVILHFSDNTIKTAEDVKKRLGLVTLAEIPLDYLEAEVGKKSKKGKAARA